MNPTVSIIIPAYNVAKYIGKCICSVLEQTYQDFEILVVDDHSTDGTVENIQQFADKRIRLFQNDCNMGPSYTRNRAIAQAQGKWLALLDADDWWASERLERLLLVAERERADMVADDLLVVTTEDNQPFKSTLCMHGLKIQQPIYVSLVAFVDWDLGITQPLIRRTFQVTAQIWLNETLRCGVDFDFLFRCLSKGARFVLVPEAYYFYRFHPGSITSRRMELFQNNLRMTLQYMDEETIQGNSELRAALRRRQNHLQQIIAYNHIKASLQRGTIYNVAFHIWRTPAVIPFFIRRLYRLFALGH